VKEKENQILDPFLSTLFGPDMIGVSIQLGTGRTPPTPKDLQLEHLVYEGSTDRSRGKVVGDSVVFDFNIEVVAGTFAETTVITEAGLITNRDRVLLSRSMLFDGEQENELAVGPGDTLEVKYSLILGFDNKKYHGSVLINGVSHNVVTTMARDVLTDCDLWIFGSSTSEQVHFATKGPDYYQQIQRPKFNRGDKEILLAWNYKKKRTSRITLDKCTVGLTNYRGIDLPLVQVEFVDKPVFPANCDLTLNFGTTLHVDY